ncbi:MAG: hypothetical protein KDM91_11460 [Verrucomicrobiae bacterium]|nr:hypothetical protein [Verrucomicrobiae bacterium]MCP5539902.1 hypothetical protein [Akkermansiaceae bacterium]
MPDDDDDTDPISEATRRFTEGQEHFARLWTDFAGKMASAGASFSPNATPPDAARGMRSAFFDALTGYFEQYLRSPEFLDSWKQVMAGAIEFRRQLNENLGRVHHEFQGTSRQDIDQLMIALTHLERRLVDTIERAEERIDGLSARLQLLEKAVAGGASSSPAPIAKPKPGPKKTTEKKAPAKKKSAPGKRSRARK